MNKISVHINIYLGFVISQVLFFLRRDNTDAHLTPHTAPELMAPAPFLPPTGAYHGYHHITPPSSVSPEQRGALKPPIEPYPDIYSNLYPKNPYDALRSPWYQV